MPGRKAARLLVGLFAAMAVLGMAVSAEAQEKKIKIGVIYDLTGPLAGGGSELQYIGAKIMIDHFAKTGVEGYKIEAVYADAQSKPDVAINEAVRLIEQEKVDMVLGFYSSAQCVPVAARVEQLKKFMWITTCISSAVLENRNLKYVFRPQPSGEQFGLMSIDFIAQNAKAKLGKEPKDLRVAIIHEDGAYGVDVVQGQRGRRQEGRLQRRAEGRLLGDRARPVGAGHQAQARAARRHLPHRLQSRHHAVAAPGARAGPEVRRPGRPRRRLRRLREAEGRPGQRRQLRLQRRPDLDLAHQPEDARSQAAADDQDGRRGVRQGEARASRSARPMSAWPRPTPTCS